jgi:feruloyl esterase
LNADSTDLSDFEPLGNKLIMYHGWADPVIPSQSSIDYFNASVGDNNLGQTQEYARLFMVPGMFHCSGGPGPNVFDGLTPLVNWVEQGVAPETIIATKFVADTPPAVEMTRPLCVFPNVAKYNGSGNTNVWTNFACVAE